MHIAEFFVPYVNDNCRAGCSSEMLMAGIEVSFVIGVKDDAADCCFGDVFFHLVHSFCRCLRDVSWQLRGQLPK